MSESNPYASPRAASSSKPNSRVLVIIRNVLVYSYLLVFCLLHAAGAFVSVTEALRANALGASHAVHCLLPIFIAIAIWFYAANRQPQQFIRGWQSLPYLTIFVALSAVRQGLAQIRTEAVLRNDELDFLVIGGLGLIIYGPAIYICFRLAYPPQNPECVLR